MPGISSRGIRWSAGVWCWIGLVATMVHAAEPQPVNFNRDVRAILTKNCLACHGQDEEHRKAGLRLDLRDAALKPTDSGAFAIVPGKVDDSELIERITTDD